ncbi:plasmid stabilization protein [Halolamina sp. CBA1230]|uniref:plastocyanin/azurin family copper-binding protein n=1 Tax=Halolamina sp. CBA1230 TaxID=1853690 RepID=UPI0009A1CBB3|nr:plastocyanin/azurin family copper-binding protein [Halolamina sp. CBA1230]QKY20337.1 plasmid stabilization protein [Halolamina sp. CBA1230]
MRNSRRAFLRRGTAAIASATLLAGCSGGDATTETESFDGPVVEVGPDGRNVFSPGTNEPLRVEVGTRVRWAWRSANHNVAVRDQPADANWEGEPEIHHSGHTYEFTFEVPGEYHYVCEPHEGMGMVGDVVVESAEE